MFVNRPVIDCVAVWLGTLLSMSSQPPPTLVLTDFLFVCKLTRDGALEMSIIILIIIIINCFDQCWRMGSLSVSRGLPSEEHRGAWI